MASKKDTIIYAGIALVIIVILGGGIYGAYEYANRDKYPSKNYVCGTFGNLTKLSMRKVLLSQWHWTYEAEPQGEGYAKFEQRCPTFTHDCDVYQGNQLVMRTDGKIISAISKVYFYDCHGNLQYTGETGSFWETVINTNRIWVSFLLKNPNGTLIAYVDQKIFITGSIDFKSPSGERLAHVDKTIDGIRWEWNYEIFDTAKINMNILTAITGKVSFSPQAHNDKDKSDICNSFFLGTGVTSLILICLLIVAGIVWLKMWYDKRRSGSVGVDSLAPECGVNEKESVRAVDDTSYNSVGGV